MQLILKFEKQFYKKIIPKKFPFEKFYFNLLCDFLVKGSKPCSNLHF
jgi:hypothetical protein